MNMHLDTAHIRQVTCADHENPECHQTPSIAPLSSLLARVSQQRRFL
jgi:hypothetical protein